MSRKLLAVVVVTAVAGSVSGCRSTTFSVERRRPPLVGSDNETRHVLVVGFLGPGGETVARELCTGLRESGLDLHAQLVVAPVSSADEAFVKERLREGSFNTLIGGEVLEAEPGGSRVSYTLGERRHLSVHFGRRWQRTLTVASGAEIARELMATHDPPTTVTWEYAAGEDVNARHQFARGDYTGAGFSLAERLEVGFNSGPIRDYWICWTGMVPDPEWIDVGAPKRDRPDSARAALHHDIGLCADVLGGFEEAELHYARAVELADTELHREALADLRRRALAYDESLERR